MPNAKELHFDICVQMNPFNGMKTKRKCDPEKGCNFTHTRKNRQIYGYGKLEFNIKIGTRQNFKETFLLKTIFLLRCIGVAVSIVSTLAEAENFASAMKLRCTFYFQGNETS